MAEVRLQSPVRATFVEDLDERLGVPGAFEFYVDKPGGALAGLIYVCPCGCGQQGALPFRRPAAARPSWIWDGNRQAPTLSPSVHHVGHWHGWLKNGFWTQA
jgi:hypothetical protein